MSDRGDGESYEQASAFYVNVPSWLDPASSRELTMSPRHGSDEGSPHLPSKPTAKTKSSGADSEGRDAEILHLKSSLERLGPPFASFDASGSLSFANGAGTRALIALGNRPPFSLRSLNPLALRQAVASVVAKKRFPERAIVVDTPALAIVISIWSRDGEPPPLFIDLVFSCTDDPSDEAMTALAAMALLSAREIEILRHILSGEANEAIAATLGIGRETVKTYVSRIYAKLHVHSREELLRKALSLTAHRQEGGTDL